MAKKAKYVLLVHLVDSETKIPYKRYITSIEYHTWKADLGEEAKEFDWEWAEDIAKGCALNWTRCDVIRKLDWLDYKNPTKEDVDKGIEL